MDDFANKLTNQYYIWAWLDEKVERNFDFTSKVHKQREKLQHEPKSDHTKYSRLSAFYW